MKFWLFDSFEKEYHSLTNTACECRPIVHQQDGHTLIIHNSLVNPEEKWTAEEIADFRGRVHQQTTAIN